MIHETIAELAVPLADLRPYQRNPRRGNVAVIRDSQGAHGQYWPIVVNQRGNVVLAGNRTGAAAKELGWETIAATFVDVDEDTAARIVVMDNRAADLAATTPTRSPNSAAGCRTWMARATARPTWTSCWAAT